MIVVDIDVRNDLLQEALANAPETTVEWVQTDLVEDDCTQILVWAVGDRFGAFETALARDPTIVDFTVLTSTATRQLYRLVVAHDAAAEAIYYELVDTGSVIKRATANADGWHLEIEFPSHEALASFRAFCDDHDHRIAVNRLFTTDDARSEANRYGLTEKQELLLRRALADGYFEIPRGTDLCSLAAAFDISHQATSERLRRAEGALIRRAFEADGEVAEDA